MQNNYDTQDLKYMASLSSAILERSPKKSRILLWIFFAFICGSLVWANYALIDERTRGIGKVIPSQQAQIIQNLEGGIISEIMVDEGDVVEKGQILIKIDDTKFSSSFEENQLRYLELKAKSMRLLAEAKGLPLNIGEAAKKEMPELIEHETSLYLTNKKQQQRSINILEEQVKQRQNELSEATAKKNHLERNYQMIAKEVEITKPLVDTGLVSQVEFLQLSRQANAVKGDLDAVTLSIPRIRSTITEAQNKIERTRLEFQNSAKEKLNEVTAEMSRIRESGTALEDRVKRALVRSPVKGIVNRLLINTVGGVVRPGMDIIEIIPMQDNLLIETKIKPSDIAYLYPGQKAIVKFTAYDFAIYGGLEGKLTHISADTIVDDKGNNFYLVRIKTDVNYLEKDGKQHDILVGMVANVDIITGKKSVMDYILKPILKAKQNALSER